jgi:hypothetical protein
VRAQSQGRSSRTFDERLRKEDDERQPTPKENHCDDARHGLALLRPSWRYPVHAAGPYSARTIASHLTSRVMDHAFVFSIALEPMRDAKRDMHRWYGTSDLVSVGISVIDERGPCNPQLVVMLARHESDRELGSNYFDEQRRDHLIDRLTRRIQRLGYHVHLEPVRTS